MELLQRKHTRLPGHDYSAPGAYFVTLCTHERKCILSEISIGADAPGGPFCRSDVTSVSSPVGADSLGGPQVLLTQAGKIVEKYILSTENIPGVHVDKYVIMPNHIHLILRVDEIDGPPRASAPTTASVPSAVSSLKRLANRELGKNIWQRSYHDHIIRGEDDYREIWNYIDTNPARWCEDCFYPNP